MINKVKKFVKKNKRMLVFIPIYILYLVIAELILGASGNDIWDDGEKWANRETDEK